MEFFLLRSIFCMAIFLLVYRVLLEKEKMHRFNRWYLLGSLFFSCIIPLIHLNGTPLPVVNIIPSGDLIFISPEQIVGAPVQISPAATSDNNISALAVILSIYGLVAFALLIRSVRNISILFSRTKNNPVISYPRAKLVLLNDDIVSHSFLRYIFVSKQDYLNDTLEKEILAHELAHVKQKHSWDIILMEVLQVFYWFNPLILLYKRSMQLNHEFLADEVVINRYEDVHTYQSILLAKMASVNGVAFASAFNFSITKKRLVMMTKHSSKSILLAKKLLILPLFALALFAFSSRTAFAETKVKRARQLSQTTTIASLDTVPMVLYPSSKVKSTKDGISQALMDEYNGIIDLYVTPAEKVRDRFNFKGVTAKHRARLEAIFVQMNKEQQRLARLGFTDPYIAPKKSIPTDAQMRKWENPENYGVWIDDRKITNDELKKYKPSDFSYYFASNLVYTEEAKRNVMKMYNLKVMYKVQLNLTTNAAYNEWVKRTAGPQPLTMYYQAIASVK